MPELSLNNPIMITQKLKMYEKLKKYWVLKWNTFFINYHYAEKFIAECNKLKLPIIWFEGFLLEKNATHPLWAINFWFDINESRATENLNVTRSLISNKKYFQEIIKWYADDFNEKVYIDAYNHFDEKDSPYGLKIEFVVSSDN